MGKPPIDPTVGTHCTHCGDPCEAERITQNDKPFCCQGCASVYAILHEHQLLDFYRIDADAGRKSRGDQRDYAWLEVPKLAERIVRYRDAERCHVALELPEIHCSSCVWLLERLPQLLPGVRSCQIDFSRKVATIVFDPITVSLRQLAEMLDRIGYPPHLKVHKAAEEARPNRTLIYRIGVAGFCFGNIMLLSFPEYFGFGADAGAKWMGGAMNYLMLALSIPVMFYAGRGFLTAAWYALAARRVTIDLPIALGMLALFGRSFYEIVATGGVGYLDSLAGLVFFLLIGRWFQSYTFSQLNFERDYRDYFPISAYREATDGSPEPVASEDLGPGDVLLVRPGQLIPADGQLLSTTSPSIDYSFVTGEAEPQPVVTGQEVFAGGRATQTPLRIAVTKPADQSYLLQLWQREGTQRGDGEVAPPEALIRVFTAAILLLAGGTLAYWYRTDVATAYRAATAVLIIACPCALALAAPFAYGTLQRLLARAGYYFRGPAVLEKLGATDTFIFDKTGTLTEGSVGEALHFVGGRVPFFEAVLLAMARSSAHPKSAALTRLLTVDQPALANLLVEGVTETVGQGLRLRYQGREFAIGTPAFCGFPNYERGTFATVDGLLYLTLTPQATKLRAGVEELLDELRTNEATWLLSGDQPPANDMWSDHLPAGQVHFRQSPFDKLAKVNHLEDRGHRVLMVGDGLNDAGALGAASVGLAVSEDEARFNPACDGIVKAAALPALPRIIRSARRLRWVLVVTYLLAFLYNAVGLSYAVSGTLSPVVAAILMPLSSVTIVIVAALGAVMVDKTR